MSGGKVDVEVEAETNAKDFCFHGFSADSDADGCGADMVSTKLAQDTVGEA